LPPKKFDVGRRKLCVFESLLHRLHRAVEQIGHELLETSPRQLFLQVNRAARAGCDEGKVDLGLHHLGQLDLGFFRRFLQALQSHAVFTEVDVVGFFEFVDKPVHDALVDVVAAEVGVTVGGFYLDDAAADFEHGDVESASAQVIDGDGFVVFLFKAVR